MDNHVRNLAISTIAAGLLGLIVAISILYFGGGKEGLLSMTYEEKLADHVPLNKIPIIGLILFVLSIYLILITAPMIATGIGLWKFQPWARWVGGEGTERVDQ